MTAIRELKRKRSKSHNALISFLQNALSLARNEQYTSIAISMKGKKGHYVDCVIIPGVDLDVVLGGLKALEDKVKAEYDQD